MNNYWIRRFRGFLVWCWWLLKYGKKARYWRVTQPEDITEKDREFARRLLEREALIEWEKPWGQPTNGAAI